MIVLHLSFSLYFDALDLPRKKEIEKKKMEPVEQFDEALGDSMTPQSENTPKEGERGDDSQESSSPSSESSSSASPPAESTRSALRSRSGQAISKAKKRKTRKKLIQKYKALSAVLPSCSKKVLHLSIHCLH